MFYIRNSVSYINQVNLIATKKFIQLGYTLAATVRELEPPSIDGSDRGAPLSSSAQHAPAKRSRATAPALTHWAGAAPQRIAGVGVRPEFIAGHGQLTLGRWIFDAAPYPDRALLDADYLILFSPAI